MYDRKADLVLRPLHYNLNKIQQASASQKKNLVQL